MLSLLCYSAQRCKTCSHYPRKAHQDSHGTCLENRPYAASKGCIPLFENLAKETLQLLAPSLQPALTLRAGGILGCARSFSDLAAWYCDDLRSSPQQRALCAFADTKFTLFCFPPHAQTLYFPRFPHPTRAGPSEFCIKKSSSRPSTIFADHPQPTKPIRPVVPSHCRWPGSVDCECCDWYSRSRDSNSRAASG
jgi:hypothetical protein